MITRWLVLRLGLSQLVCWGISYYLIGVFGPRIAADLGWSTTLTYAGFSGALATMGLVSGRVGGWIDRHGGRRVMSAGSLLLAAGCVILALSHGLLTYFAAWAILGIAMRMTLYEAAFASLARIGGTAARRPIAQITLLGGLASSVFWPIGHALAGMLDWRGAVLAYAVFALATLPLHWAMPDASFRDGGGSGPKPPPPRAADDSAFRQATILYALVTTIVAFLNSANSAHMIGLMTGLGVSSGLAVSLSTLRGIGQTGARLCEVLFGARLDPLALGTLAAVLLPLCFLAGLASGVSPFAAAAFALGYGISNGLLTIVRGTQPLVLFDPATYGALVGRLTAPAFFASALAPVSYAALIDFAGPGAALSLSAALGLVALAGSAALWFRFRAPPG
ncbi:MFS transporter [Marinibaculum pumilum]|uniref:MFS transporter n=1 Tax=Marinibaculum pumilum TaxID=1766165 RepID=A0ABV7KVT1_9PROT